jgi:chromosome segregation ATPase
LERQFSHAKKTTQEDQHRKENFKKESSAEINKLLKKVSVLNAHSEETDSQNQMISSERERLAIQLDQLQSKHADTESNGKIISAELEVKIKSEQELLEKLITLEETVSALQSERSRGDENAQNELRAYQHNSERQTATLSADKNNLLNAVNTLQVENESLVKKLAEIKGKAKGYKIEAETLKLSLQAESQKSLNRVREMRLLMQDELA